MTLLTRPGTSIAESACTTHFAAEQERITREFMAQPPKKGDKQAAQAWSKRLNEALAAMAQNAEQCERENRPVPSAAAKAREQDCLAANNRHADALARKYRDRTLDRSEQATRRAEEDKLMQERMACSVRPSP